MLLGGVAQEHPNDDVVTFREGHILVGEVVVGLDERRGDYVPGAATKHKTEEPLGCFVGVAGKRQPLFKRGVGGPKGYRTLIHVGRLAVRFILTDRQPGGSSLLWPQ